MSLISITLPADGQTANVSPYNTAITSIVAVLNGNIDSTNFAPGSISTASIADNSITSVKIADGTILGADIASSTIPLAKLATGTTRLGIAKKTTTSVLLTTTLTTYATITATSTGKECEATFTAYFVDANSSSNRGVTVQVTCDGVVVDTALSLSTAYVGSNNSPYLTASFLVSSTPTAGSHVWNLQASCSNNTAVYINNAFLRVAEVV